MKTTGFGFQVSKRLSTKTGHLMNQTTVTSTNTVLLWIFTEDINGPMIIVRKTGTSSVKLLWQIKLMVKSLENKMLVMFGLIDSIYFLLNFLYLVNRRKL